MKYFYQFLDEAFTYFKTNLRFKSIFLLDGTMIYDLIDIPSTENCLFVSTQNLFTGINLFNKNAKVEFIFENYKNQNQFFNKSNANYLNSRNQSIEILKKTRDNISKDSEKPNVSHITEVKIVFNKIGRKPVLAMKKKVI